jgi:hypothetical protein
MYMNICKKILPEILHLASLHLTVGLGVERFIFVAFPLKAKRICTFRNEAIFSALIFIISICSQIHLLTKASFKEFTIEHNTSNSTISGCLRSAVIRTHTEYILRIVFLVFLLFEPYIVHSTDQKICPNSHFRTYNVGHDKAYSQIEAFKGVNCWWLPLCQCDVCVPPLLNASFKEFTIEHNTSNSTISGCLRSAVIRTHTEYILRIVFLVFLPCLILIIFKNVSFIFTRKQHTNYLVQIQL